MYDINLCFELINLLVKFHNYIVHHFHKHQLLLFTFHLAGDAKMSMFTINSFKRNMP